MAANLTVRELAVSIGKPVLFRTGGLTIICTVTDARMSFGKPQFEIEPLTGTGSVWVEFSSIEPFPEHPAARNNVIFAVQRRLA